MSAAKPQHPRVVIADAFTLAYGSDGEQSIDYWHEGADLAVGMLIEAGLCPPEFDTPPEDDA